MASSLNFRIMTVLLIIIVLAILVGWYFVSTQRSLVNLDELCKNALSQIEVQLNSRWDAVLALARLQHSMQNMNLRR